MSKRGFAAEAFFAAITACWVVPSLSSAAQSPASQGPASEKKYDFNIDKQPLSSAISAFLDQTGLLGGALKPSDVDAATLVGPVKGPHTIAGALKDLLPAGYTYKLIGDNTISIRKKDSSAGNGDAQALLQNPLPDSLLYQEHGGLQDWGGPNDLVIVIGTKLSMTTTDAQATAVVSQRKIESYGVSTLPELMVYLPQIPFFRSAGYRNTGEQYANLRGLGPGTTLVLINGRRADASAASFDNGGFDLNTIPLTAVKRVEILVDSPSLAAGVDGIAGTINIVLKEDIPSPTTEVRFGSADGGSSERRASLAVGTSTDRFRGAAIVDAFQRDYLMGSERDLTANQDYRRFGAGGIDFRAPQSVPPNITSATGQKLPGLDTLSAAVPAGLTHTATLDDFIATAGQTNLTSLSSYRSLIPQTSRMSLVANGEFAFSPSLSAFTEFLGSQSTNHYISGVPTITALPVSANNPFNSFHTPVLVSAALASMEPITYVPETDRLRLTSGIRAKWSDWEAESAVTWTQEDTTLSIENQLDLAKTRNALNSSDPATALNVFTGTPTATPSTLASLVQPTQVQNFHTDSVNAYSRVRGSVLTLASGSVDLVAGADWRREEQNGFFMPEKQRRTVSAGFAEVQVPLISDSMKITAVNQLALSAGLRADDYSDLGSHISPQYGVVWRPLKDVKVRMTYSTSYRAPLLYELNAPLVQVQASALDPKRHTIATFATVAGGNPDLAASPGHSLSSGVEYKPDALPNLRLSVDYWRTAIDSYIAPIALPVILAHEDLFPGRVVRAAPTAQDIAAGQPGVLQQVVATTGNFGHVDANGMDFDATYVWKTSNGHVMVNLTASWNDHFTVESVSGLQAEERVGVSSTFGTIPRWRAVSTLEWARGPLTLFAATRYVAHFDEALLGVRDGRSTPAQILADFQASLQMDSFVASTSALNGVKLSAGAMNILNAEPHLSQYTLDGYDPAQGDIRQRFWYVRLAKEF